MFNTKILSPEQGMAMNSVDEAKPVVIEYMDICTVEELLFSICVKNMMEKQKTLVIYPTSIHQKNLIELFRKSGLGLNFLNPSSGVLETSDYSKIRTIAKKGDIEFDEVDHRLKEHIAKRSTDNLVNAYNEMNKTIFGDRKWSHLVHIYLLAKLRYSDSPLENRISEDNYTFDLKAFWKLRGMLEEASQLYKREFDLIESQENFGEALTPEQDFLSEVDTKIEYLKSFIDESRQLIKDFHAILSQIAASEHKTHSETYVRLKDQLYDLEAEWLKRKWYNSSEFKEKSVSAGSWLNPFRSKPKKRLYNEQDWTDKSEALLHALKESKLLSVKTSTESDDILTIEDIKNYLSGLENWRNTSQKAISENIKRLNKLNADFPELDILDKRLSGLCTRINEKSILKEAFENNAHSTIKQMEYAKDMLKKMEITCLLLEKHTQFFTWKAFLSKIEDSERLLIDTLKHLATDDWLPAFETWYLGILVKNNTNPEFYLKSKFIEQTENIINEYRSLIPGYINYQWHTNIHEKIELLKKEDKNLFNLFFKKKETKVINWNEIMFSSPSLIADLAPVTITDQSLAHSMSIEHWDHVILVDDVQINLPKTKRLTQFIPLNKEIIIDDNEDPSDIEIVRHQLLLHTYNYLKPIADLPLSEKLKAAKILAKMLLSTNSQLRIFQHKNANIISLLSEVNNRKLYKLLDKTGVKEIRLSDQVYDRVIESILETNRQQILLCQDGLIDLKSPDTFEWQQKVITSFETAGFAIRHLWTVDILRENDGFSELIDYISSDEKTIKNVAIAS